ncbi:glycosyl transferase family 39, partial [Actinomadura bangladeshensis]|nr:glycosyl transferase family 39 [Actinomadura bangladeshensis]
AYAASAASTASNGTNPLAGPATGNGFGMPGGMPDGVQGGRPGAMPGGPDGRRPPWQNGDDQNGDGRGRRTGPGGFGGPGGGAESQMISYLQRNQGGATWLVAVSSAQEASSIILQTGRPVIAMGGFTGSDPAMTVDKLQRYVQEGELRYILLGGRMGPGGGGSSAVTAWVQQHGTLVDASEYGASAGTGTSGTGTSGTSTGAQLYRLG